MGVLSSVTRTMRNIVLDNDSSMEVVDFDPAVFRSLAREDSKPMRNGNYGLLSVSAPRSLDYFDEASLYFVSTYQRASYYFYNCSIFNMVVRKITEEALRNGIECVPRFQCKCPRCGTEYDNTTKRCRVCGFEGKMRLPDLTQRKLLVNWRGNDLLKEVNKNGWTIEDLAASYTILSLVYNQPLILCKSKYGVKEDGTAIEEFPQEFVPIAPTKARMMYDDTGEPGKNIGFTLRDRYSSHPLVDESDYLKSGYFEGQRLYPVRWCVSEADGGWDSECTYYAEEEIFHKVYSIPSMTYGTPICTLIEYVIRAWIAMDMRIEKYYNTGHPQGIFAVSGITPEQMATIQQSIREQMTDDPYMMPMMGIPPGGGDTVKSAKWFQLADNPTADMMEVRAALQQNVSGAFGVSGLFLGDVHSIKGNSNETQQMAVMDRSLTGIRKHINSMLEWVTTKYSGVTDWIIRVVEPADEQTRKQAEDLNKELINAQLAQQIGFPIISLIDNKVEIGDTPVNLTMMEGKPDGGGNMPSVNDQLSALFGIDVGDSEDVGRNMMRDVAKRQDPYYAEKSDKVVTMEQIGRLIATLKQNGYEVI